MPTGRVRVGGLAGRRRRPSSTRSRPGPCGGTYRSRITTRPSTAYGVRPRARRRLCSGCVPGVVDVSAPRPAVNAEQRHHRFSSAEPRIRGRPGMELRLQSLRTLGRADRDQPESTQPRVIQVGGVRHDDPAYIWFDLAMFATAERLLLATMPRSPDSAATCWRRFPPERRRRRPRAAAVAALRTAAGGGQQQGPLWAVPHRAPRGEVRTCRPVSGPTWRRGCGTGSRTRSAIARRVGASAIDIYNLRPAVRSRCRGCSIISTRPPARPRFRVAGAQSRRATR
jgi:hypothetical protein